MLTQKTILPSGISAEVRGMFGKELAELSNAENIKNSQSISKVISKCLLKLGEENEIIDTLVSKLTEPDYRAILMYCRVLSYRLRPNVKIPQFWGDIKHVHEVTCDDKKFDIKFAVNEKPPILYSDVLADKKVVLPESGTEVIFNVAAAESKFVVKDLGGAIKKRNPRFKDKNGVKSLDIDELSAEDFNVLYETMIAAEGSIDTTAVLTNPNNANDTRTVDLISCKGFFFPLLVV